MERFRSYPLMPLFALMAFVFLSSMGAIPASAAMVPDTLIRNVRIIRSGESEITDLVNLTILNSNLEMISKDSLEPQEGMHVFDANEGFLLGNLVVG